MVYFKKKNNVGTNLIKVRFFFPMQQPELYYERISALLLVGVKCTEVTGLMTELVSNYIFFEGQVSKSTTIESVTSQQEKLGTQNHTP